MYGFMVCSEPALRRDLDYKYDSFLEWGGYCFFYSPLPKFEQDHIFCEYEGDFILLDGVITNKDELMKVSKADSWLHVFSDLLKKYGKDVVNILRGSFCGVLGLKKTNELIAFTDQIGSKIVVYAKYENNLFIASHASLLSDSIKMTGKYALSICNESIYELLSTGSILGYKTPFNQVKRITAGHMLVCGGEGVRLEKYHMFHNVPEHELTIDECIDKADDLFRRAVDRIFRKNVEYGYRHECDLSGGLDSRMATWIANDLGYKNIINICYSVKNSLDNKVSRKICSDLGNEYFFLPMDAYIVYDDIDKRVELSGGQVFYLISTGAYEAITRVSKENNIGICCTGLLGEIQNAYWIEGSKHTPAKYISNRRSYFLDFKPDDALSEQYENFEQMNLYEYSCKTFLLSGLVRQQNTEVLSPFWDTDYLEFIYRVPLKWRMDYGFIQRYMCNKYPKVASYVWQTKRVPVINYYKNKIYLPKMFGDIRRNGTRMINKVFRTFNIFKAITYQDDMNPFQAWYLNNSTLRSEIDEYYRQTIDLVPESKLKEDMKKMFEETKVSIDKFSVINALSIFKQYGTTASKKGE